MSEVHPTQQAVIEAIDRLSRTPDGAMLYILLQRQLMTVIPTTDGGALQVQHGERMFAAKLVGLMHKGIHESGGRHGIHGSTSGPGGSEQPVVVPIGTARAVRPERASSRRITEHTRVPGYDLPDDDAS